MQPFLSDSFSLFYRDQTLEPSWQVDVMALPLAICIGPSNWWWGEPQKTRLVTSPGKNTFEYSHFIHSKKIPSCKKVHFFCSLWIFIGSLFTLRPFFAFYGCCACIHWHFLDQFWSISEVFLRFSPFSHSNQNWPFKNKKIWHEN